MCLVLSPSLCDVYIMWKVGKVGKVGEDNYQEGVTSPPQKTQKGSYLVTSVFTTTKNVWDTEVLFTCAVRHDSLDNNTASKEDSVSKSKGNSC